jgi:hypothetical protein
MGNLRKNRPRIFLAAEIFLGPLLRFAAEISAGWQHCWYWVPTAWKFPKCYSDKQSEMKKNGEKIFK